MMTVSHVWHGLEMHDASVNYQNVTKGLNKPTDLDYDVTDEDFKELN